MDEERGSPIPESEAVRLGHELYGLEAAARSLPGEYDDNFHLTSRDGRAFVLKVMHPQRERGFVDMQCAALQHLAARAPELALPRVIPTRLGEPVATIAGPGERARLVFMLGYVPASLSPKHVPARGNC
jgi:Ser/Thr protein kinase RdoA (MazF antagonist)